MIVRTVLPVERTSFRRISEYDATYYTEMENTGRGVYPFTCHGCGTRLGAGQRICSLLNTTNDYTSWCYSCAHGFNRREGY